MPEPTSGDAAVTRITWQRAQLWEWRRSGRGFAVSPGRSPWEAGGREEDAPERSCILASVALSGPLQSPTPPVRGSCPCVPEEGAVTLDTRQNVPLRMGPGVPF